MLLSLAILAGCQAHTVREPYPVEVVREVVKPIPDAYTSELIPPDLPEHPTVLNLVEHIKAWQAFGKTANEHRAKVKELSRGR